MEGEIGVLLMRALLSGLGFCDAMYSSAFYCAGVYGRSELGSICVAPSFAESILRCLQDLAHDALRILTTAELRASPEIGSRAG